MDAPANGLVRSITARGSVRAAPRPPMAMSWRPTLLGLDARQPCRSWNGDQGMCRLWTLHQGFVPGDEQTETSALPCAVPSTGRACHSPCWTPSTNRASIGCRERFGAWVTATVWPVCLRSWGEKTIFTGISVNLFDMANDIVCPLTIHLLADICRDIKNTYRYLWKYHDPRC